VGSADLELGDPCLLASVGRVVSAGNQIAGGTATVVGTVCGAILLTLLVATVTMAGLPIEFQNIARGRGDHPRAGGSQYTRDHGPGAAPDRGCARLGSFRPAGRMAMTSANGAAASGEWG
jgi:ribose transport system permease protein